jgi:hypothetical protein
MHMAMDTCVDFEYALLAGTQYIVMHYGQLCSLAMSAVGQSGEFANSLWATEQIIDRRAGSREPIRKPPHPLQD